MLKSRKMGGSGAAGVRALPVWGGVRALPLAGLCLVLLLGRLPTGRLPQVVKGDDVLSVAFGDARAVIARMMIEKSDSYFHGGVDIECPCEHCKEAVPHRTVAASATGDDQRCDDNHACRGDRDGTISRSFDPWSWINARIRAPQQHIHLEGEKSVELLPFYWAALKADPHDVEAWTTAIFIASDQLKDDALAARLIVEAKAKNPESAEIAFAEGRYLRKKGKDSLVAAQKCFARAEQLLNQKGVENWTEDDKVLANLIQTFLTFAK